MNGDTWWYLNIPARIKEWLLGGDLSDDCIPMIIALIDMMRVDPHREDFAPAKRSSQYRTSHGVSSCVDTTIRVKFTQVFEGRHNACFRALLPAVDC